MNFSNLELKKELANSISHGFGVLFGVVSIPILIAIAVTKGDAANIVGTSIYGFSFLMVFSFSTLYHSITHPKVKKAMKTLDHISIYFLIAGSYTPFILAYVFDATGITLLSVLWGLTLIGIVFKIFFIYRFKIISTLVYLAMGWLVVFFPSSLLSELPTACMILVAIGGVLYSLGVIFYLWKGFTYHHAIWHVFVLAASICHYVAVLLAIA